jgi:arginase
MPVAVLLGEGAEPLVNVGRPGAKVSGEAIAMIGIRSLDPPEKKILKGNGVGVYTMRHIDERGMGVIAREVLERLSGFKRLHISLDMDALDPTIAPGVGTPVNGGIRYREAHLLMEILAESRKVHSMDIVEINPILDDRNTTAQVAVGLAASLFGETIL